MIQRRCLLESQQWLCSTSVLTIEKLWNMPLFDTQMYVLQSLYISALISYTIGKNKPHQPSRLTGLSSIYLPIYSRTIFNIMYTHILFTISLFAVALGAPATSLHPTTHVVDKCKDVRVFVIVGYVGLSLVLVALLAMIWMQGAAISRVKKALTERGLWRGDHWWGRKYAYTSASFFNFTKQKNM